MGTIKIMIKKGNQKSLNNWKKIFSLLKEKKKRKKNFSNLLESHIEKTKNDTNRIIKKGKFDVTH